MAVITVVPILAAKKASASIIVWMLYITMNSGLSAEHVVIQFTSEGECEDVRSHITTTQRSECRPEKLKTK